MIAKRFNFLDSMRGFAAGWVVLFHLNEIGRFAPTPYQWVVKHGWLGVSIFFVLSGYSIHASLLRSSGAKSFLRRRFWRIYPPYVASIGVVMVVVILRKFTTGVNDLISISHGFTGWLEIMTLTTSPITSTRPINWVYWTLSYEAAFYLWLSLALLAPKLRWPILFAPLGLSLIWHNAPVFFINQWCLFALGAAIAEWLDKPTALVPALVITSLCDALMHLTIGEVVAASSAFVLVVMAVSARFAWINREPVLHRLGDWSYSLYLTHVPIGVWVALGVDPYPRTLGASSFCLHLAFDAFAFTVCVVFAFVFWNLVERPAIAMSHRKSSRRGRSDIVA